MKEYLIDLYKKTGGLPTKTRVFASNQASALKIAKQMNPDYRTGGIKQI
jgi:type I site-specific restriction endonuclease